MPPPVAAAIAANAGGNLSPASPAALTAAKVAVAAGSRLSNANACIATNYLVIGDNAYTFVADPTTATQVMPGSVSALVAAINGTNGRATAHRLVAAAADEDDLILTAKIPGSAANAILLAYSGTVSGVAWEDSNSTMTGGSDAWPVAGTPTGIV
jgi:hypothetical protein